MKFMPVVIGMLLAWVMVICTQTALAEAVVERTVAISGVNQLHIEGDGALRLRIGDTPSLKMTALASELETIKVDASGELLRIRQKGRWGWSSRRAKIQYELTLQTFEGLTLNGGLDVDVLSPVVADDFYLHINGGGAIRMTELTLNDEFFAKLNGGCELNIAALNAHVIDVTGNGAADITIAGRVQKQLLKFNGAAEYHAFQLESETVEIRSSGANAARLWVTGQLDLHLNGAGGIYYYGDAQVHSNISGVGSVERKGDKPSVGVKE
ncbi:MAG TPA: DUF2807 domain-containing protein [Marinagarivorans sp.]